MSETLRKLPQIQSLLEGAPARRLAIRFSEEEVTDALRAQIGLIRSEVLRDPTAALPDFSSDAFFASVEATLAANRQSHLRPVINATGIIIHTNLGRAPLAPEAIAAITEVSAGYSNLEFDLEAGVRGSRYAHVDQLICEMTGAEAAIVVNNCAAAVVLCLSAFAAGREVITSRGELIEIGGSFRLPDVIAQSGACLVEVGATNKTRLSDYANAIGEETAVLLKSHTSNYRIVGFTAAPDRAAISVLSAEHDLVFMEDLGSGVLIDLSAYGLPDEPVVGDILKSGVDIVTFSGDKWLGGPQAGIIAGRADLIAKLKTHPLLRALRIDKLSLAALEATLRLYKAGADPVARIPVLKALAKPLDLIRSEAEMLRDKMQASGTVRGVLRETVAYAGGGSLPQQDLESCAVGVVHDAFSANELADRLRSTDIPVICRVAGDKALFDTRTTSPEDHEAILAGLRQISP